MQIVALDVETTGLDSSKHRIVEIGGVIFDSDSNEVLGEFETLINPLRNIPQIASEKHGLTADHLSAAPTFEEFGPWLSSLLNNRFVVAHNEGFDRRFIRDEFVRIGLSIESGPWICTQRLTGGLSLLASCEAYGVELVNHHSALDDARACLNILRSLDSSEWKSTAFNLELSKKDFIPPATLTRLQVGLPTHRATVTPFSRKLEFPNLDGEFTYLAVLNEYLEDLSLSAAELDELNSLAISLGLSSEQEESLRVKYLDSIESACMRDGILSEREAQILNLFAQALGIESKFASKNESLGLPAKGSLICVTGTALIGGKMWDKQSWKITLEEHGYRFTDDLRKSDEVALLLQESEGSLSGKVKRAMSWGIPRMTFVSFLGELGEV